MRTKVALGLVVAVLAIAAPAHAKGPSGGIIEGEGIDTPIAIDQGEGTSGGDQIINDVGFFQATFGQMPDVMLDEAPISDLGPKLTIRWRVPGMEVPDEIEQDLYPYADGGPIVYTAPDQPFFGTEHTRGGWFRAPRRLLTTLTALGLPDEAALSPDGGGDTDWAPIGASLAAVVMLGAGLAVVSRRRGEVAPAAG